MKRREFTRDLIEILKSGRVANFFATRPLFHLIKSIVRTALLPNRRQQRFTEPPVASIILTASME